MDALTGDILSTGAQPVTHKCVDFCAPAGQSATVSVTDRRHAKGGGFGC